MPSRLRRFNHQHQTIMNEEIKIEKNVPIPENGTPYNGVSIAMRKMNVGDSFIHQKKQKHSGNLHALARMNGIKIITRRQPDGTYRIWRKS